MKCLVLIIIALFGFAIKSNAQNLVPNSSFENLSTCSSSSIDNVVPWCSINGMSYDNVCINHPYYSVPTQSFTPGFPSFQVPRTGNAYINGGMLYAITTAQPRYAQVPLINTLTADKVYCVTYYVSLWNDCKYSTDKLGALFTATPFNCAIGNQTLTTGYTPQIVSPAGYLYNDTLNWQEVSGTFIADGTEAYLTIGNFFTNAQHTITLSYPSGIRNVIDYYLDDVSVEVVEIAKAKNDTSINQGDSTIIGLNNSEAALFSWQPSAGLSCTNCPNPKASPSVTTTYTVTKTQCKSLTSDVITVTVSPVGIDELINANGIKISPNPAKDVLNIDISTSLDITKELSVKITDVLGREILLSEFKEQLDISQLETGIYFVSILQGNKTLVTKKVIKE